MPLLFTFRLSVYSPAAGTASWPAPLSDFSLVIGVPVLSRLLGHLLGICMFKLSLGHLFFSLLETESFCIDLIWRKDRLTFNSKINEHLGARFSPEFT